MPGLWFNQLKGKSPTSGTHPPFSHTSTVGFPACLSGNMQHVGGHISCVSALRCAPRPSAGCVRHATRIPLPPGPHWCTPPSCLASSELNTLQIGMLSCAFPIESLPGGRGDPVKVAEVSNKGWLCIFLCSDKSTNTKADNKHGLRSPIVLQPLLLSCSLQKATQRSLCLLNLSRNTLLPPYQFHKLLHCKMLSCLSCLPFRTALCPKASQ